MKDLEQMILEEISSFDDMRLIDVLAFIRYLKAEKPIKQEWIAGWFEQSIKSMHEREEELQVTPAAIKEQLQKRRVSSSNG